jgi:LacI family transcriptional regulator, galactose operon repressor
MTRRELPEHATLDDVAREAGVSRATAARALGGYGSVGERARERVVAAAEALRYRPNVLARSMKSGSTRTLGVVVSDIQLAFFAQAVRGIADAAREEDFEVILANTDEDLALERAAVGVLVDKRVDGLIVVPAEPGEASHLVEAQERGIPVVLLDRGAPGVRCDVVVVDNQRAAKNAVRHLVRLGHRRVAIVVEARTALPAGAVVRSRLRPDGGMTSLLREAGWAAALHEAGLSVTDDLICGARYDRADARRAAVRALAQRDRPTAFVTTDETMTLGAIDAIQDAGLEIPRDISLVAFDDLPWTTLVRPPLTVVAQPVLELGRTATQRLLGRVAGLDGPPETVVLSTSFVVRGSTGPAPGVA